MYCILYMLKLPERAVNIVLYVQSQDAPIDLIISVNWALTNANGTQIIAQSTDIDVTFLAVTPYFSSTPTPGIDNSSKHDNSLKAAIAIFVVTIIIAAVTFATIGIFIWKRKVQKGLKEKLQQAQIIASQKKQQVQKLRRFSGTASGRTKVSIRTVQENGLHRTHSTIGFPATVENYQRQKHNKQTPSNIGQTEVTFSASQPSVLRCRSLPNLSDSQLAAQPMEGILIERRRNLNKVHTRVKKLNSQHAEAQKSSSTAQQRLLQAYRVDNLKTLQGITPKQNNYGVNESKLNTEKEGYRKEFASFAVRSIAASAKTPEPGSTPRTVL